MAEIVSSQSVDGVSLKTQHISYPIELCAIEIARASDCGSLSVPRLSLEIFAQDLIQHSLKLMGDSRYQFVALDSTLRAVNARYYPLSQDLLPIMPTNDAKKAREAFNNFDKPNFYKILSERIAALGLELETKKISELKEPLQASLAQLAEFGIMFLLKNSLPREIEEFKKTRQLDLLAPAIDQFTNEIFNTLPAGLENLQKEIVVIYSAYSIANLQHARCIGDLQKTIAALESRLSDSNPDLDEEFADKVCKITQSMSSKETDTIFEDSLFEYLPNELLEGVPTEVVSAAAGLAYQSELSAARNWLENNSQGLDAMMVNVVLNNDYRRPTYADELQPAVKAGIFSTKRAQELISSKLPSAWNANNTLNLHLMRGAAPRILESIAITGASAITVYGDMPTGGNEKKEELSPRAKNTLIIIKNSPALTKFRIPLTTVGKVEDIIHAELSGINRKCEGTFIKGSVPATIHAIEKRCGGPVAWIQNSAGQIENVLVFDSEIGPPSADWDSKRIASGVILANTRNKIEQPKIAASTTNIVEAMPMLPKIADQTPTNPPTQIIDVPITEEAVAIAKSLPQVQSPTHILPPEQRKTLSTWLQKAEADKLFGVTLQQHEEILRKAAQGKALNAKAFKSLRGLEASLRDKKRRPAFSVISIHDRLDELAEIVGTISA